MKLKNEPKRHRFWSKIQFFFPRMVRVLTSSKLKPNFSRFERSLCARHVFPQKRQRQRVERKKRARAHAWVPFPIQSWRTHWKLMQKIVIKAGNEFYVCGRACDVSLQNYKSSPGYLAFFFAFDWLLALEFCLHTHPFVVYYWNGTLAPRVKKNWTPVILTFHHPPKCENALFFVQTDKLL